MNASEMIEVRSRSPFESFDILMNDGQRLTVKEPFQIATAPNSACCTVYDNRGEMHIVSYRNIERIVTAAETPTG